jgi:hypothetical protein
VTVSGVPESKKGTNLIELGNKLAVLVGINEYADSSINRLSFCVKDILDFNSVLVDPEKGRYEKSNIKVLSDTSAEKPTRNNILSKLTAMSRTANPEDSILFYFSGHGAEIEGRPYLLCSDSYRNTIEQTALPNELMRKTMESSLARVKMVILDACHSGVLKGAKESGIMTRSFFESFFPPPEGFVVLSSCKLGESSHEWPEREHGVFSYYLLEGLKGTADRDGDKIITITDAHRYTSDNVKRWAFEKGLEQNPTLDAKISGDIPLVYVTRALEKEIIDKSTITQIIMKTTWSEDRERQSAEKVCGSLLQFVEASDIEDIPRGYKFPYGEIHSELTTADEKRWSYRIETLFEYEKENWEKIDEIIRFLDEKYYWNSIAFRFSRRISINSLIRRLKQNAFEIISYAPEKGRELVVVNTKGWLGTMTTFQNREGGSEISIATGSPKYNFPDRFYSTLSPENILEFVRDCLE